MACARPSLLAPKNVGFLFAVVFMFDSAHGESSTQLIEPTFPRVVYASDNCAISGFFTDASCDLQALYPRQSVACVT